MRWRLAANEIRFAAPYLHGHLLVARPRQALVYRSTEGAGLECVTVAVDFFVDSHGVWFGLVRTEDRVPQGKAGKG